MNLWARIEELSGLLDNVHLVLHFFKMSRSYSKTLSPTLLPFDFQGGR